MSLVAIYLVLKVTSQELRVNTGTEHPVRAAADCEAA